MANLDFDFIMTAATAARLDVMEAYGFGPSFLAYLDTNNVSVEDFLRKCHPSIRLAVGRILGLTDRETLEYMEAAERPTLHRMGIRKKNSRYTQQKSIVCSQKKIKRA